jgi:hypothetical protein
MGRGQSIINACKLGWELQNFQLSAHLEVMRGLLLFRTTPNRQAGQLPSTASGGGTSLIIIVLLIAGGSGCIYRIFFKLAPRVAETHVSGSRGIIFSKTAGKGRIQRTFALNSSNPEKDRFHKPFANRRTINRQNRLRCTSTSFRIARIASKGVVAVQLFIPIRQNRLRCSTAFFRFARIA